MIDDAVVDRRIDSLAMSRPPDGLQLKLDDGADLAAGQCMKDDDLVDAVDEFRPEMGTKDVHQLRDCDLVVRFESSARSFLIGGCHVRYADLSIPEGEYNFARRLLWSGRSCSEHHEIWIGSGQPDK